MYHVISSFHGQGHEFLSNFWPVEGTTAEHLYQSGKTFDQGWKDRIMSADTPGQAKRLGRNCPLRSDWGKEKVRIDVMMGILAWKFAPNRHPDLWAKLKATGNATLIEGNNWGDRFWGATWDGQRWVGRNELGKLLMYIRDEHFKSFETGYVPDGDPAYEAERRAERRAYDDEVLPF